MRIRLLLCAALLAVVCGCSGTESYFRLDEWGQGWKLQIDEKDGRAFEAKWVKGDNTSMKLVNYHSGGPGGDFTIINTLFLELDGKGNVRNGRLRRVVTTGFDEATAREKGAQWFRVLQGWARVDGQGRGKLEVRCEGDFEFAGNIEPMDGLEITRPK
ncbi:MAG: hypothetical protein KF696_04045 [Planctomycetes bacterium]|nr:hypothetical protein [Planctomycetota bacterium]MCW8134143.1 hypothetical protein [Planctomycetota bacterium]